MAQKPFDPNEFANWFIDGIKETVAYRVRETLNRQKITDYVRSKIPSRNQVVHQVLKTTFEKNGFQFETLKQGDASFQLLRKRYRDLEPGQPVRRLVMIPGFGDSPASWMATFGFARRELTKHFDELLVIDFPGYLGFLSHHSMVPSMAVLQGLVKTVCEANPPTVLVGHSLGGWLAAKAVQELKRPIEHLIVISPSGLIPETERAAFGKMIVDAQAEPMDRLLHKVMHSPKKFHQMLGGEVSEFYSQPEVKQFVESVKPEQFINPMLPFSAQKISVIWGDQDEFVPAHWMRYWVEYYGEFLDAYRLKDTAHLPQIEHPYTMAAVLVNAVTNRPGKEGRGWTKVHSRKREQLFQNKLSAPTSDPEMLLLSSKPA